MNKNTIKSIYLKTLLIFVGTFTFSTVFGYGGETVVIEDGAGCEIPEVIEVEPDCTDPFFQDMEHKAQAAAVEIEVETPPPVAPAEQEVAAEAQEVKALPTPLVFENPIDVVIPTPEPVAAKIEPVAVKVVAPKKVEEKIIPAKTIPAVVKEIIPVKAAPTIKKEEEIAVPTTVEAIAPEVDVEEPSIEADKDNEEVKEIDAPDAVHSVAKQEKSYQPLALKAIDSSLSIDDEGTHASALSAITTKPVLSVGYVFNNHLREIVFLSFIMFLLFSLLFI